MKYKGLRLAGLVNPSFLSVWNGQCNYRFLCACTTPLVKDAVVEVYLSGHEERYVGKARVARKEVSSAPWQNYGFQFIEKTEAWVLQ